MSWTGRKEGKEEGERVAEGGSEGRRGEGEKRREERGGDEGRRGRLRAHCGSPFHQQ